MKPDKKTIFVSLFCYSALIATLSCAHAETSTPSDSSTPPEGTISSDVLGRSGGLIHPFISSSLSSTDNYLYSASNIESDLITTISPGVWASLSRLKEQPETVATSSMIPGGHAMPRGLSEGVRRLHTFAMYRGDFDFYSQHSEDDTTQHYLDGALQYSMPGGLTIGIDDQFNKGVDPRDTSSSVEIDRFTTNLTGLSVAYKIGERLQLATRLSNFAVDYRDARNDFRDRDDKNISLSLPFALSAKTTVFTGYSLTDISYDSATSSDSSDQNIFAGLSWKMTGKSRGQLLVGYGIKNFDDNTLDSENYLSLGANLNHSFSSKSSVRLSGYRKTQEASVSTSDFILTDTVSALYSHRFTARWAGLLTGSYEQDSYKGDYSGDRKDTMYSLQPAMRFFWGERLFTEVSYKYQDRDSNLEEFSYQVNRAEISLEYAL